MSTIVIIFFLIVLFFGYHFLSDKNKIRDNNLKRGGMKNKYPNFVIWCKNELSIYDDLKKEFVKDDGEYLEYRNVIKRNNGIAGYLYFGVQDTIGTFLYCYCVSTNGNKTNKSFYPLPPSPYRTGMDLTCSEYENIFDSLLQSNLTPNDIIKLGFE